MDTRARYAFRFDVFSFHIPIWEQLLQEFRGRELNSAQDRVVGGSFRDMDPRQSDDSSAVAPHDRRSLSSRSLQGDCLRNLAATGRWAQITVVKQRSAQALSAMASTGREPSSISIYIDGDHSAAWAHCRMLSWPFPCSLRMGC